MKYKRSGGSWLLLTALCFAAAPPLAADESSTAVSANAATVEVETGDDGGEVYVVHDQVFVEETAPEIPGGNTVAAKLPLSLRETPLSVDTVDATTLETRDDQILGDALENVTGVNVQSGNGIFDFFTLRGLDATENGLVLVDGAREPQTAFYQLYNVERVEVLKGPSSFLYGGVSMGGAVNLVRKQPRVGNFTSFGLSGGSYSTWQGTLDANYSDPSETWGLRFNGQWWQSDLYRDGKEADNYAVNPALTWHSNDRTSVHVNLEYVSTDAVPDSGLPLVPGVDGFAVPDVPRTRSYDVPFDRSEQETYRFQVDVESHLSESFLLRNKTYYRRLDWLSDATSLDAVLPIGPLGTDLGVARSQQTLDDRQAFTGNQLEALWKVDTGGVSHNLLFGLEVARLADEFTFSFGSIPFIALFNPVESAVSASPLFGFGTDARSTVVAPYAVDQIRFSDKFQLLVGLRWDSIDFEDSVTGLTRDDSKASPMIGAVYSPSESVSIYVNAGQAFSPQSTFVVGESREPEESDQVELGLRWTRPDGKLRGSLAFYRLDRTNVAIPDRTGVLRQTGKQRNDGAELEISSELRRGLSATFHYSWTDAELTEFTRQSFIFDAATGQILPTVEDLSGNTAAWVPENIASLWLSQRFDGSRPGHGWGVGAGGRWVDKQFINEDNAFAIDGYFMADAALWFTRSPWRFQVNLDNLTDEKTFTRVFAGNSVIPAPGFTVRAGIRYGIR